MKYLVGFSFKYSYLLKSQIQRKCHDVKLMCQVFSYSDVSDEDDDDDDDKSFSSDNGDYTLHTVRKKQATWSAQYIM